MSDVMVISPHPDDGELGMGGAISKFVEEGLDVVMVDLTNGEPTPYGNPELRAKETSAASAAMGITQRINLGLPNRELQPTIEARKQLAAAIRQFRPRLLFTPYFQDAHPDHVVASELSDAARFTAKLTKTDMPHSPHYPKQIIYYFCSHLKLAEGPSFVLDISSCQQKKRAALEAYQSQFYTGRDIPGEICQIIVDRDRYFGTRIGVEAAEPFFVHEPVGLKTIASLL